MDATPQPLACLPEADLRAGSPGLACAACVYLRQALAELTRRAVLAPGALTEWLGRLVLACLPMSDLCFFQHTTQPFRWTDTECAFPGLCCLALPLLPYLPPLPTPMPPSRQPPREMDRERARDKERQHDLERERARHIKHDLEVADTDDELEPWERRPISSR